MTVPRRLTPGRTYAVVRRTARRCFFLTPTAYVRDVVLYAIGLAQLRHPGVALDAPRASP